MFASQTTRSGHLLYEVFFLKHNFLDKVHKIMGERARERGRKRYRLALLSSKRKKAECSIGNMACGIAYAHAHACSHKFTCEVNAGLAHVLQAIRGLVRWCPALS